MIQLRHFRLSYTRFAHEYGDGLDVEVLPPLTQRLPL